VSKDKIYTVRAGRRFEAIENGSRVDKHGGETVRNLTEDQLKAFGDVFEETVYGGEKTSYVSDTPDGNPDTTKVMTEGLGDGHVANPTIGPAEAGQSPPVVPGSPVAREQVAAAPVAARGAQGGNNPDSQSSSEQSTTAAAPTTAPAQTTVPASTAATPAAPAQAPTKPAGEDTKTAPTS